MSKPISSGALAAGERSPAAMRSSSLALATIVGPLDQVPRSRVGAASWMPDGWRGRASRAGNRPQASLSHLGPHPPDVVRSVTSDGRLADEGAVSA